MPACGSMVRIARLAAAQGSRRIITDARLRADAFHVVKEELSKRPRPGLGRQPALSGPCWTYCCGQVSCSSGTVVEADDERFKAAPEQHRLGFLLAATPPETTHAGAQASAKACADTAPCSVGPGAFANGDRATPVCAFMGVVEYPKRTPALGRVSADCRSLARHRFGTQRSMAWRPCRLGAIAQALPGRGETSGCRRECRGSVYGGA